MTPNWDLHPDAIVFTIDNLGTAAYFTQPVRLNPNSRQYHCVIAGRRYDAGLVPRGPDSTASLTVRPGKEAEYQAILDQNPAPSHGGQHRFGFLDEINAKTHHH